MSTRILGGLADGTIVVGADQSSFFRSEFPDPVETMALRLPTTPVEVHEYFDGTVARARKSLLGSNVEMKKFLINRSSGHLYEFNIGGMNGILVELGSRFSLSRLSDKKAVMFAAGLEILDSQYRVYIEEPFDRPVGIGRRVELHPPRVEREPHGQTAKVIFWYVFEEDKPFGTRIESGEHEGRLYIPKISLEERKMGLYTVDGGMRLREISTRVVWSVGGGPDLPTEVV